MAAASPAAIIQAIYYRRAGVGTSPQTLAENRAVYSERRTDSSAFIGSKGAAVCLFVCLFVYNTSYAMVKQMIRFVQDAQVLHTWLDADT